MDYLIDIFSAGHLLQCCYDPSKKDVLLYTYNIAPLHLEFLFTIRNQFLAQLHVCYMICNKHMNIYIYIYIYIYILYIYIYIIYIYSLKVKITL